MIVGERVAAGVLVRDFPARVLLDAYLNRLSLCDLS
jgi:hypothetical protein